MDEDYVILKWYPLKIEYSSPTLPEMFLTIKEEDSVANQAWHLDNISVGSTTDIHQVQIYPRPGVHKLTIYDNIGLQQTIEIIIK